MNERHRNHGVRKVCRCQRRKWPKCAHGWYLNYQPRGGPNYRLSLDVYAGKHIESKTEAVKLANAIKAAIDAGTFKTRREAAAEAARAQEPPTSPDAVTLKAFGQTYFERRGKPATANDASCLTRLVAFTPEGQRPLGETPLASITEDQLELFFAQLRQEGRAASTRNKYVQLVKALFRWATKKGYLARNPVADSESIKREKHAKRSRRLAPDVLNDKGDVTRDGEERRLLAVAGLHLNRLIIAALDTGMRRGELLTLLWRDVDLQRRELTVRAENTKTRKTRHLPISFRLAGVLEMAHAALEALLSTTEVGRLSEQERIAYVARCYVFGDETGGKVTNIKRAWETAVLKAHGHAPEWAEWNKLATGSRAALRSIDLHFHDLRHEAGSRLLEAGVPLHHVQAMLGHENLSQTSTYLNATRIGLHESMRRLDDARCKPVAQNAGTDHPPLCNTDSLAESNLLVN
jgi:integrase